MSSAVNVLTNSPKIRHVTKRDFFRLNSFHVDQYIWERCCRPDWNSVLAHLPCSFWQGPLKRHFLDIYLTTLFGVPKLKITSAMTGILSLKMFKIEFILPKCKKKKKKNNTEKVFSFWDNCIWRCCDKLCLIRTEYLSSAVNMLTNSPKTFHITKRDFFQMNCLHNDQ